METAPAASAKDRPQIARIRAKVKDDHLTVRLTDGTELTLEKSALVPPGTTDVKWRKARIDQCRVGIIPAAPKDIRFIASDVLTILNPGFAAEEIRKRFESAPSLGQALKRLRKSWKLSIGRTAELSGVDGLTIARMEAGYPVYPATTFFKVASAIAKLGADRGK